MEEESQPKATYGFTLKYETDDDSRWRYSAKCVGENPDLFEIDESNEETRDKIRHGITRFCAKCPVTEECLSSASPDDLKWSVRGGMWPRNLSLVSKGRPKHVNRKVPESEIPALLKRGSCMSGKHEIKSRDDLVLDSKGAARCALCYQAAEDAKEARRKANAPRRTNALTLGGTCRKGLHVVTSEDLEKGRCQECRLKYQRAYDKKRAAKKAAAYGKLRNGSVSDRVMAAMFSSRSSRV